MIQAVLLDIGNVVLEIDFEKMVGALVYPRSEAIESTMRALNDWEPYDAFERGGMTPEAFQEEVERLLGKRMTPKEFTFAWNAIFVGPVPGVEELLQAVSSRAALYGLSNANVIHMTFAQSEYALLSRFRHVYTSYELGARKPEALIYEKACRAIGVPPERVLFADDKPENVEGARRSGLNAELCDRSAERLGAILRRHGLLP